MRAMISLCAVGLVTCSHSVNLTKRAERVEMLDQENISRYAKNCTELGEFEVASIPAELSGEDGHSVLAIKARNEAGKLGATHVLLWPSSSSACDKDGTANPESQRVCEKAQASAYECVIGRGS